jgi:hypothetical protein
MLEMASLAVRAAVRRRGTAVRCGFVLAVGAEGNHGRISPDMLRVTLKKVVI